MLVSKQWLQDFIVESLPDTEKLVEELTMKIFEIDGVEQFGDDDIIDVKVLPDRKHYCLSHRGIAKEICALFDLTFKEVVADLDLGAVDGDLRVAIKDTKLCRRYLATKIEGVKIGESPEWLKNRLESIGQRSINNIVDATNFVMYSLGQPLHSFDADEVVGGLIARAGKEGEVLRLLDSTDENTKDREIVLGRGECVIADDKEPLVLAGIKGGMKSGISEKTKNIILEAANFDPVMIRRFSTIYNSRSETSTRFENEITTEYAEPAMKMCVDLILKIAGGKLVAVKDVYPVKPEKVEIRVSTKEVAKRLGVALAAEEITALLKKMNLNFSQTGESWVIAPESDRFDLRIKEDVMEELGRLYGYDKIPSRRPEKEAEVVPPKKFVVEQIIRSVLLEQGLSEVYTYALAKKGEVELANSVSVERKKMRANLFDAISEGLEFNAKYADLLGLEQVRIFEIGNVFLKSGEETRLVIGVKPIKKQKGKSDNDLVREIFALVAEKLGVVVDKVSAVVKNGVLEINLQDLVDDSSKDLSLPDLPSREMVRFTPFSSYPFVVRDVAVWAPQSETKAGEMIKSIIKEHAGELLVRLALFDKFDKDGRSSYAYRVVLQSIEKTLEEVEIKEVMDKIYQDLSVKKDWEIR